MSHEMRAQDVMEDALQEAEQEKQSALREAERSHDEALEAFQLLCKTEGIIPALEPSHALAEIVKRAPKMGKDQIIVMNLCGRGDKDVFTVGKALGVDM